MIIRYIISSILSVRVTRRSYLQKKMVRVMKNVYYINKLPPLLNILHCIVYKEFVNLTANERALVKLMFYLIKFFKL